MSRQKQEAYAASGQILSMNDALEEVVADGCETMLADNEQLSRFVTEHERSGHVIVHWLERFRNKLRAASIGVTASHAESLALEKSVKKLQEIWTTGLIETSKTVNESESTKQSSKHAIKRTSFTADEIRNNSIALQTMDAVAELTGNEFKANGKTLLENVVSFFDSLNNNVYSDTFGDVGLTKSSARSDLGHGSTREKIVAYAAIPEVIKNGVVIDDYRKAFNANRIVVAAPIMIASQKYYMGVMLSRDMTTQRLYAHDVVIEKEPLVSSDGHLSTTEPSENKKLHITDILLEALNVKQNGKASVKQNETDGYIKTYNQRDKVMSAVEKHISKLPHVDSVDMDSSGGMGSTATFYAEVYFDEGLDLLPLKIRYSGHTNFSSDADVYLWNSNYNGLKGIYASIDTAINSYIDGEDPNTAVNTALYTGKASIKEIVGDSGTKYGRGVYLDSVLLENLSEDEQVEMVKLRLEELSETLIPVYDKDNNAINVRIAKSTEKFKNDKGRKVFVNHDIINLIDRIPIKRSAIAQTDELLAAGTANPQTAAKHPHDWLDNNGENLWDNWRVYMQEKDNTGWEATLHIANSTNGEKILYDIKPIKKVERPGKTGTNTTGDNIPQTSQKSNTQNGKASIKSKEEYQAATEEYNSVYEKILYDIKPKKMEGARKSAANTTDDNIPQTSQKSNTQNGKASIKDTTKGKASLKGYTADGTEVYETSDYVKSLPWHERRKEFIRLMEKEYAGRTAKFTRNGHTYYAKFESVDVNKNIFGDKRSDDLGRDAKINTGADGGIFDLVENAEYSYSSSETGKTIKAHNGIKYWDYFVKTVQIDGKVFDVLINVRKALENEYIYSIQLNENKNKAASPVVRHILGELNGVPTASKGSVSQASAESNTQTGKYSLKNTGYLTVTLYKISKQK